MNKLLKYKNDGTFKILQITDIHYENGNKYDIMTYKLIENIINAESPDFIAITGDAIYSPSCNDRIKSFNKSLEPIVKSGIPWSFVFGNHDTQEGVTRKQLLDAQLLLPNCYTQYGDKNISGVGNYILTVYDHNAEKPVNSLIMMDSGSYPDVKDTGSYDWIKRDQIEWYVSETLKIEKINGKKLPSLIFFHIALPEYDTLWYFYKCYGIKNETVCCPNVNSGMFAAMVEMGNVCGVFVGHDHINDYWGEMMGVRLYYGRATGYNTYGQDDFKHGARVIQLHEDSKDIDSWIRLDDGSIIKNQPEHNPEGWKIEDFIFV